jgi:hypothetical protein
MSLSPTIQVEGWTVQASDADADIVHVQVGSADDCGYIDDDAMEILDSALEECSWAPDYDWRDIHEIADCLDTEINRRDHAAAVDCFN